MRLRHLALLSLSSGMMYLKPLVRALQFAVGPARTVVYSVGPGSGIAFRTPDLGYRRSEVVASEVRLTLYHADGRQTRALTTR